ncbi:MAG: hypothetical protein IJ800_01810 [Clostridia bacterium]|nr:hypothetical protein [Clostridia bacterium]
MKKLGWKGILLIVTCAVVIFGMGSTAIANVRGLFNKDNSTKTETENSGTNNASVEYEYVL